ncbi:MAG: hypothetical protein IPK26_10350 [Planctomycetes bacterium]|nr:hypothetical protein [Planctomycetota bacterium]
MRFFPLLLVIVIPMFCSSLAAQRTLIVDRLNRPGTDFLDMQPAVDAALNGDVIVVRSVDFRATGMCYEAPTVDNKSVTIRGELPRPPVVGQFVVRNLAAGRRVTISGFRNGDDAYANSGTRTTPYRGVGVLNCSGIVVIDQMVIGVPNTNSVSVYRFNGHGQPQPILVQASSAVYVSNSIVHQCYTSSAVYCDAGRLFATDCYFGGGTVERLQPWPGTVMVIRGGEINMTNCTAVGTDGWWYAPLGLWNYASGAVVMAGGVVRCAGNTSLIGGWTLYFQDAAVEDYNTAFPTGPVYVDPRTSVQGGFSLYTPPTWGPVAGASWTLDEPSQTVTLRQYTEPGAFAVFAMGTLQPTPTSLPQGLLYLNPGSLHVLGLSSNSTGDHTLTLSIAPLPAVGTAVTVQGAELTTNGTIRLTQPIIPGRY